MTKTTTKNSTRGGSRPARQERQTEPLILLAPIAMGLGIAVYFALPSEPSSWLIGGVGGATLCVGALWFLPRQWVRFGASLVALLGLGFLLAVWEAQRAATPQLKIRSNGQEFSASVLWSEPRIGGARLIVRPENLAKVSPAKLVLYGAEELAEIPAGCRVQLRADLRPFAPPSVPNGYDARFTNYYRGIAGLGFVREITEPDCSRSPTLADRLARLRQNTGARIANTLAVTEAGVAKALLTGARDQLTTKAKRVFRDSGLAHMLAISGLHMVLMAGSVYAVLRFGLVLFPRFAQAYDIRKFGAVGALLAGLSYLLFSGAGVATQRAFAMMALLFLAILINRWALTMRNVALAALVVLAVSPHSMTMASFQMSFSAVIALVAFYENFGRGRFLPLQYEDTPAKRIAKKAGLYFIGLTLTSLIAGFVTGFLSAYHFQRVAVLGLIANLLAMPILASVVMPAGLVSLLAMPAGLEAVPLKVMGWGIAQILAIAEWATSFRGAALNLPASQSFVLPLATLGLLWLCLWQRRLRFLGVPLILLACLLLGRSISPDVYVLGQGYQFGVLQTEGLRVSKTTRRSFEALRWQNYANQKAGLSALPCDSPDICVWQAHTGDFIAFAKTQSGLAIACQSQAKVLISHKPIPKTCKVPSRWDRRSLRPFRVLALRLTKEGAEPIELGRKNRLWARD